MYEHREAVEYDLMQRGYTLKDVGERLSWDALDSFIAKTEPGSALSFELDPERAQWGTIDGTNTILADIYDLLATINYNVTTALAHRKQRKPAPYERPGQKSKKRRIGNASIPIADVKNTIFRKLRGG